MPNSSMEYKPLLSEEWGDCPQNLFPRTHFSICQGMYHGWQPKRSLLPDPSKTSRRVWSPWELDPSSCLACAPNLLGHVVSLRNSVCDRVSQCFINSSGFTPAAFQASSHSSDFRLGSKWNIPTISPSYVSTQAFSVLQPTESTGKKMAGYLNFCEC